MVKIKFTAQGANALVGGFGPGDMANVGEALAKHLVEEAQVAVYVQAGDTKPKKTFVKKPKAAVSPAPTSDEAAATAPETTAGN